MIQLSIDVHILSVATVLSGPLSREHDVETIGLILQYQRWSPLRFSTLNHSRGSSLARRIRCLQRGGTVEPTEPWTTVVATLIG